MNVANAAIILSGGFSRRLGRDKCQVALGDETMIGHVLRAVHHSAKNVRVVGRERQQAEDVIPAEFLDTTAFVCDAVPDRGPLEGMRAGMESLPDSIQLAFVCGCDCPLITPNFIEFMFRLADGYEAAVPWIDGELCPIPAVYRKANALAAIKDMLTTGERSLWRLVERLQTRRVTREELEQIDSGLESLINVNDVQTLDVVSKIWSQRPPTSD